MAVSERDMKPEIKSFRDKRGKEAERLVFELFPKKIQELNDILEGDMFSRTELQSVSGGPKLPFSVPAPCNGPSHLVLDGEEEELEKPASKKRKLEDGLHPYVPKIPSHHVKTVPCNPKLSALVEFLKPEIMDLVDRCNSIKTWIQMMIPKIEDGNNFGVSIQEDILAEVGKSEADAGSYLEQMSRYYTSRAKILSKCAKYPFLEDYQRAVDEYDQKVFVSFKLIVRELRNIYIVVYDVIVKNYEKIVHPRSENTSSLY